MKQRHRVILIAVLLLGVNGIWAQPGGGGGNITVSYSTGQASYTPTGYRRANEGQLEQPGNPPSNYNSVIPGTAWLNNSQTGGSVGSSANGLSTTPGTYTGNNSASRVDGRGDVGGNIGVSYSEGRTTRLLNYRRSNEGRLVDPDSPENPPYNPVIPGTPWLNNSQTGGSISSVSYSTGQASYTPSYTRANQSGSQNNSQTGGSVGIDANGLSTTPGTYTGNNSGSRISLRVGVIGGTITGG